MSRPQLMLAERVEPRPSFRMALRDRTAAVHEALHVAAPFAAIAAQQATVANYIDILLALNAFHSSMALMVEQACGDLDLADLRRACVRRRALLAADLRSTSGFEPPHVSAVPVKNTAWAVGCLYTLVGSTLGGKLIHRQLDYLFDTSIGRRFFAGTAEDGAHWRAFCRRLELFAAEQHDLTPLVEGAHFAFEHFASCLEQQS